MIFPRSDRAGTPPRRPGPAQAMPGSQPQSADAQELMARSPLAQGERLHATLLHSPGRFVAARVELVSDHSNETIVARVITHLHPAEPTLVGRDGVGWLDLVPGVLQGIVTEHAGALLALVEDGDSNEQLALAVIRQVAGVEGGRSVR